MYYVFGYTESPRSHGKSVVQFLSEMI